MGMPLGVPSVAPAVAATNTGAVASTSHVRGREFRVRTHMDMAIIMGARRYRPAMRARPLPVVVWTEARCPWSVPVVLGGVSVL